MAKETEKRLLEILEFLQEPQGSTIPTIVKAINTDGPQVSLKKIVQTLRGCLDNGVLKVTDGRVKFNQCSFGDSLPDFTDNGSIMECGKGFRGAPGFSGFKRKGNRNLKPMVLDNPENGNQDPPPEGGGDEGGGNCPACPPCPECPKKKKKPKCPKKKPKCPKPKKKPKCPKPKPKCPKPKPKCPKAKKKPKKCSLKKKLQPFCRKKKKCPD